MAARRFFCSCAGYVEYLRRFFVFQQEAERWLADRRAETVIPDFGARRRAHLACADLRTLGVSQEATPEANEFQSAQGDSLLQRPDHILGVAYVLEGATLGGAVILKLLAPLGISAKRGASFFFGYGAEHGVMWRRFLDTLAFWETRGVEHEEVIRAARETFAMASRHLLAPESAPAALSSQRSGPLRSSL